MFNKDFFKNMSPQTAAYVGCASLAMGMFMFGIGNALIKESCETLPTIQVVFMRSFFSVCFMTIFLTVTGNLKWLKSHNYKLQVTRGVIGFFGLTTLFYSFAILPLPEATAFTFLAPLMITALSAPILKERVSIQRWLAVIVGFGGVLIIAQPKGNVTFLGASIAIISASIESVVMIMSRILKRDKPITSVFYHTGIIALIALVAILLPPSVTALFPPQVAFFLDQWKTPCAHTLLTTASLGLVSCLGHVCIVYAYTIAPAVVVAPMLYTLIIWGALFGYMFWGETISTMLIFGTPLIIGSGIYIVRREKKERIQHIPETELG